MDCLPSVTACPLFLVVMLSPDGAIIASGYTQDGGGSKMFVTRSINAVDFSYYGAQSAGLFG